MTRLEVKGISRYYYFNDNAIKNIIFYNDDGIIMETKQGWLECHGDIKSIECGEIASRNKVNLTRKENFVIKESTKHYQNNKAELTLYLYVDNCNIKIKKTGEDVTKFTNDYNLSYGYQYYSIFEGEIDGEAFKMRVMTKHENIDIKEKEQAQKLYESIKDDISWFIKESDFYKLYNICKISKRAENLMQ